MGFLSPWFLGGLLAVGIPLYVHLLQQHKMTPHPFSSLMFFERRTQSSVKHRRLRYLLLLAMRLAIVLLLALTFANIFVTRPAGSITGGDKLVVLAIDNSFSMRAGGRLERAKQEALGVVNGIGAGDRAQVIAFSSGSTMMTQPTSDRNELRTAIQAIQPEDGRSLLGEISRTLRSVAHGANRPVEAHIFSDMQKTSLPSPFSELAMAANTKLVLHAAADRAQENFFVESVQAPQSVYQAKGVKIRATVASSATDRAFDTTASLILNGKAVESKQVKVSPNSRAGVEFLLNDAPYGLNRGEVRVVASDALKEDDRYPFAFERKETTRVLFVYESRQPRGLLYYRAALEASPDGAFSIDSVSSDTSGGLSLNKYGFVVLNDVGGLPSNFESELQSFTANGGNVFVSLGPVAATRPRVPVANLAVSESRYSARTGERFQTASSVDETHPSLWKTNRLDGVKFYQAVRVSPGDARVLAKLSDGTPLVLERKVGQGRVIVFASSFDNIANDFPLHASFVPFVEQTAKYLSGMDATPAQYAVGDFIELRTAKDKGTGVEVIDAEGKRALSLKEAASAQNFRLDREGYFEVRRANGRHELIASHANRLESDLTPISDETLKLWGATGGGGGSTGVAGANEPVRQSLWWWFALALLIVSIAESVIGSRYLSAEQIAENQEKLRPRVEAA